MQYDMEHDTSIYSLCVVCKTSEILVCKVRNGTHYIKDGPSNFGGFIYRCAAQRDYIVTCYSPYIHHHLQTGEHMYWWYVEGTLLATSGVVY